MCISCFRPGGSHFPKRPSLLGENQALGYSLLLTWLHILASHQSRFFGSYRTRGTRTGSSSSPRATLLPMGIIIHLLKSNHTCMARTGPCHTRYRWCWFSGPRTRKLRWAEKTALVKGKGSLLSYLANMKGNKDRETGAKEQCRSQMGGPPCSARCWQHRAGVCRHPGPWCSPPHPQPVAAWQRHNSPGYMPHAALSSLETDT